MILDSSRRACRGAHHWYRKTDIHKTSRDNLAVLVGDIQVRNAAVPVTETGFLLNPLGDTQVVIGDQGSSQRYARKMPVVSMPTDCCTRLHPIY